VGITAETFGPFDVRGWSRGALLFGAARLFALMLILSKPTNLYLL
jgi:hypothetical protein